jgi:hypothetical protein
MEVAASADTSTGATEVTTDAGRAYIKPMGNRQGPHVLATDWVGTHLAKWFGLSTFDVAIIRLDATNVFELPRGARAEPGPAFVARAEAGDAWGGGSKELETIINPQDITRLVVFDTWTLNCDRHHFDPIARRPNHANIFLSTEGVEESRTRLIAMDHGLCFIRSGEDLTTRLAHIDKVQDEHVYGLFPEFRCWLRADIIQGCASRLNELDAKTASEMIETVPTEWEVTQDARKAWVELVYRRAGFVADNVQKWIEQEALEQAREIDEHVEPLFTEYGVRLIRPQLADAFAGEVEQSAH